MKEKISEKKKKDSHLVRLFVYFYKIMFIEAIFG